MSAPTVDPKIDEWLKKMGVSLADRAARILDDPLGEAAELLGFGDGAQQAKPAQTAGNQAPATATNGTAASSNTASPDILGGADTDVEKKLAEFTKAMSDIVVTVDNKPVTVRPPYHINAGGDKTNAEKNRANNSKVNKLIGEIFGTKATMGGKLGKATPEEMRDFLQKAVDQNLITDKTATGLRAFLDKYGVSVDCSGLATQALNFLADGNLDRDDDDAISVMNVNSDVINTYEKLAAPSDLQPGDLMVKPGEFKTVTDPATKKTTKTRTKPGHVRIITDIDTDGNAILFTTLESADDDNLVKGSGDGVGQRRWRFPDSAKFEKLEIQDGTAFKAASAGEAKFKFTRFKKKEKEQKKK